LKHRDDEHCTRAADDSDTDPSFDTHEHTSNTSRKTSSVTPPTATRLERMRRRR
jgi:hypothetical protein